MAQKYNISFKGQRIFVGIDVHKKTWHVAVITESGVRRSTPMNASAQVLSEFLRKHYPDGDYLAAYEAGFCGFSVYYALKERGIECLVVNAADIPTSQYETVMKTDKVDAEKLAKSLKAGQLNGIYIREKDNIDDRAVVRIRKTIAKELGAYKSRVKHLLYNHGVEMPERFRTPGTHWSRAFICWLKEDVVLMSSTRSSLDLLLGQVEQQRQSLLSATRKMRELGRTERYAHNLELLMSIPGIGPAVGMCILTEVYDISRFKNERQFASYLGLIPTSHSSGEKTSHGEKTFRGNKAIGPMLVEASWIAIGRELEIGACYANLTQRMKGQEAIIRIARKLSNIVYSVLKNDRKYVPYSWDSK